MASPPTIRPPLHLTVLDRRIVFLMAVAAFVAGYSASLLSHTLPYARKSLELTEGEFNWVFAATRAASLLAIAFAIYGDRHGRRKPFMVAFTILPIAGLLTAVLPGVIPFTLAQSFNRVGVIATAALSLVILAEELTPRIRSYGIGIHAISSAAGSGLSLILLPITERSADSWRWLFALSALGFLAVPLLARFLNESRAYVQHEQHVTLRQAIQAGIGKYFWPLAAIAFFVAAFTAPAFSFVLERLVDDLEWQAGPARFLLMVFSGIGALGFVVGGRIADLAGRKPAIIIALAMGLIGGVGFYTATSGWLLAPAVAVASFGSAMFAPAFGAQKAELFPTRIRATVTGWIANTGITGSIAGFTLGAFVTDTIGLSQTIALLGLGLVVAAVMTLRLPETRGRVLVEGEVTETAVPNDAAEAEDDVPPDATIGSPVAPQAGVAVIPADQIDTDLAANGTLDDSDSL